MKAKRQQLVLKSSSMMFVQRTVNIQFQHSSVSAARALSHSSVVILLDFSFAFDTVNHQILLSTLDKLGIAASALT